MIAFDRVLIELQSFLLSKLYIDPIHRVLMYFPLLLLAPCKTWCFQVNVVRISVFFVHSRYSEVNVPALIARYPVSVSSSWGTDVHQRVAPF